MHLPLRSPPRPYQALPLFSSRKGRSSGSPNLFSLALFVLSFLLAAWMMHSLSQGTLFGVEGPLGLSSQECRESSFRSAGIGRAILTSAIWSSTWTTSYFSLPGWQTIYQSNHVVSACFLNFIKDISIYETSLFGFVWCFSEKFFLFSSHNYYINILNYTFYISLELSINTEKQTSLLPNKDVSFLEVMYLNLLVC